MTYLIPTVFNFILVMNCGSLIFRSLSHLAEINTYQKKLFFGDIKLLACAQRKANILNIKYSYYFLLEKFPEFKDEFKLTRDKLLSPLKNDDEDCFHEIFKNIKASAHLQKKKKQPEYWPNWIQSIEVGTP